MLTAEVPRHVDTTNAHLMIPQQQSRADSSVVPLPPPPPPLGKCDTRTHNRTLPSPIYHEGDAFSKRAACTGGLKRKLCLASAPPVDEVDDAAEDLSLLCLQQDGSINRVLELLAGLVNSEGRLAFKELDAMRNEQWVHFCPSSKNETSRSRRTLLGRLHKKFCSLVEQKIRGFLKQAHFTLDRFCMVARTALRKKRLRRDATTAASPSPLQQEVAADEDISLSNDDEITLRLLYFIELHTDFVPFVLSMEHHASLMLQQRHEKRAMSPPASATAALGSRLPQ